VSELSKFQLRNVFP